MPGLVELKCKNCGVTLAKDADEPEWLRCPACGVAYKEPLSSMRVDVRVAPPPRTAEDELRTARDVLGALPDSLVRWRTALGEAQQALPAAEAALAAAKQQQAKVTKDRKSYVAWAVVGAVLCFLISISAGDDSTALIPLVITIALLGVAAFQVDRLITERRRPNPAVVAANSEVADLKARIERLCNNIEVGEQHLRVRHAQVDTYFEGSIPGMQGAMGRR